MGGRVIAIKFHQSAQDAFADLNQARSEHVRVNPHQANEASEAILVIHAGVRLVIILIIARLRSLAIISQ